MIRPYKPEDLDRIIEIGNKAWQPIYDSYEKILGNDLAKHYTPNRRKIKGEQLKVFCQQTPDQILICEVEGNIVGFLTYFIHTEKQIGEIDNNAVDPDCGLKGIGQQMYNAVLDIFRKKQLPYAMVRTGADDGHTRARAAYERTGFKHGLEYVTYFQKL